MRRILGSIKLGLIIPLLVACQSVNLPGNRFEIPEAMGKGKADAKARFGSVTQVDIDATLVTSEASFLTNTEFGGGINLGLTDRIDGFFDLGLGVLSQSPATLGFKFQLLGQPQSRSKKGNFSMAIVPGLTYGESDLSDENENTTMASYGQQVLGLLGYRLSPEILVYAGGYYADYRARIKSTFAFKRTHKDGFDRGAMVGLKFNYGSFFILMESAYSNLTWDGFHRESFLVGASVGVSNR